MKKKIALLLAVIMTLSLMPMTVFAGSSNYLAKGTLSLKKDTAYNGDDKQIMNGLVIEFKDAIASEQKFRLELTNAEFSNLTTVAKAGVDVSTFKTAATNYVSGGGLSVNAEWSTAGGGIQILNEDTKGTVEVSAVVEGLPTVATVTVTKAAKNDKIAILLPIETDNVENAEVSITISANNSYVSEGTFLLSRTTTGSTVTVAKSIKTGRELITLDNIVIKETLVGSLENISGNHTAIELLAPAGYEFVDYKNIVVVGTGEFSKLKAGDIEKGPGKDASAIRIGFNGVTVPNLSSILPESIILTDVKIQPIDDDDIPFGKELEMGIYKFSGEIIKDSTDYEVLKGLSEGYFKVAKPVNWTMSVTAATAKDVVAGRYDTREDANQQVAAKVTFKENIKGTWLGGRTTDFTLPEGVSIRGIKFNEWKNIYQKSPKASEDKVALKDKWTMVAEKDDEDADGNTKAKGTGLVTIDQNKLSLKGIESNPAEKAEIQFTLYLSISPEFKGETISLTTGGTAINQEEIEDVVIANSVQPIKVSVSKVADVQIGFQKYAVGDIIIEETKPGMILRNVEPTFAPGEELTAPTQGLELVIEDYISAKADIELVPIKESQVEVTGDLKVTLKKSTTGSILFDVDRVSTQTPSKITIKGVEIKINRTVPYGVYDLVVKGQSVFANQAEVDSTAKYGKQVNGLFDVYGYTTPYINVATEGMNSPLKANVKIAKDSDIVLVDGVQQKMAYPTYFDVEQSSFLVPARFISHIFGVEENNIFWNDSTKTVSIITANRTLQFTANSDVMVVAANGAPSNVTMTAKAILHPVTERLYVPFRAIGDAFGVPVAYDEATQMGEYNPVVK